jgi:hypothetical protein
MMAHELLRQAATILGAGWSKGSNARDATGRIVPLFAGAARAGINPNAVAQPRRRARSRVSSPAAALLTPVMNAGTSTVGTCAWARSRSAPACRLAKIRGPGPDPGSHPRECTDGTAATFDLARADFEHPGPRAAHQRRSIGARPLKFREDRPFAKFVATTRSCGRFCFDLRSCRPQWWRGGAVWHNASARFVRAHRDERDDCRRGFAIISKTGT